MASHVNTPTLLLPAIRGQMGDWVYYVSVLKMKDAAERVKYAEEIHESRTLNDFLQRRITKRSKTISDYLIQQPQRLFNALVVGVYEGNPRFAELALRATEERGESMLSEQAETLEGMLGYLILNGNERLFAIDGQHRIVGIRDALRSESGLADEEVSVIFIGHSNTMDGKKRTSGMTQKYRYNILTTKRNLL